MEEFLGVLFCGGKGVRLREITRYISKSFIPVYDTPAFSFGLELLKRSGLINKIIILTNSENNSLLSQTGCRTIIQNDEEVNDMFSGWDYIKKVTNTKKNGVLFPGDNICEINIDKLIRKFVKTKTDFLFSIRKIKDKKKLSEMGSFDIKKKRFHYKNPDVSTGYGVIAPYIIRNTMSNDLYANIFELQNAHIEFHEGYWFDIGDYDSIVEAGKWRQKNK